MKQIADLIATIPLLQSLRPETIATIAGCGSNCVFQPGDYILREGEPEDEFYVLRAGSAAIETFVPQRGPLVIETIHEGDALGWSWLFPPYRARFDARAIELVNAIAFDGACLRGKSEADPALGYDLLKLFGSVIVERLQHTRLRLLDVYAPAVGP
jgi:CRP/FNR family transcriptional regulator, cyclic AMP receptor protein